MEGINPSQTIISSEWKILIIDDDEEDFLITREMLKEAKGRKFDIHWASTYKAGREELISDHYNAVLVDYDLGAYSGIDLIREANERGYPSPLILFTGRGNYEVDVEAMQAGATLYLSKGEVNPLLLERVIRYAIELKQKEQSLRESEAALRASEAKEREKVAEMNALLDAVPVVVWITHDTEAKEVTGNQPAHDFLHVPVGKNLSKSAPTDAPRNFKVYQNGRELAPEELPLQITAATGQPIRSFEEEVVFDDGDHAYLLGNVSPLLDDNGKPCGAVGAFINITEREQAEQALKKAEERFAKAFHSSPASLAITRASDGRYIEVNETLCQVTGYSRNEIIGHTALELGIYANPAQRTELVHLLHEQGTVRNYEIAVRTKSGIIQTLLGSFDLIELDNEPSMLATLIDITERKQTDQALKESERRLRDFVEITRNNYIALDREWRFTYANRNYGEVIGVDAQELLGKNYWELFPHYVGSELEQNYRKVMIERVPLHYRQGGIYTGNVYDVSLYPTQEGIAIFSIDRTEELRRQQQLENERARLEAVLQALPVGVWITDRNGQIIGQNDQANHIWAGNAPLVEGINQYLEYQSWDVQNGKKLESEDFPLTQALSTGQPVEPREHRIQRFDGSEGFVLVSAMPIHDREGQLMGAVAINVDITKRKQDEQALKQAEEKFSKAFLYNPVALTLTRLSDGHYLEVNENFYQLTGYNREEIIGHTVHDIRLYVDPHQRAEMTKLIKTRGRLRNYEIKIRTKSGTSRTILTSIDPIEIAGEACILTTFIDITERERTEQALHQSEARLRDFLENTHESFFILDRDWHIQYMNRNFAEILHTSMEALSGKTFWEAFPVYQGTPVEKYYRKVMEERTPAHFEMGGMYSPTWFDISVYPTHEGIGISAVDRSEEKRTREALLKSQVRLERAQQIAHLGSWELDLIKNQLTWSDEVYRIFGLQPQEFNATYKAFLDHVHPDDRAAVDEAYTSSLKENRNGYEIEHRVIRAHTGEIRFVHEKAEHYRDAKGQIVRSGGMVHDITERKQAEEALRESEQEHRMLAEALGVERAKLAAAIEELPVGVCIGDAEGNVLSLNTAGLRLHDFSSEAEMFSRVENYLQEFELRFLDGQPIPVEEWPSSRALSGDYVQNYEVILHNRQTGVERVVAYSASPVMNSAGETLFVLYTLQDLTERKEAEEALKHYAQELERSNQALQDFAFIASHDLQEPLRKIILFGSNLQKQLEVSSNETAGDYLERMQNAARRMQSMINGLLELSRVNSRGRDFVLVNLNHLAAGVVSDLEVRIQSVDGKVQIEDLPSIEADELQMRQLIQNLIGNAIKFHRPGTPPIVRVSGSISRKGKSPMVEIQFQDNGIGFEQDQAERIFQPFQRLHGRNEYEGTGLGLAICQKIVERHNGTIEVQSMQGKGSTFIVRLPLKQDL